MAKAKLPKLEDLNAYFFMSVSKKGAHVVYNDVSDKNIGLGAAFASILDDSEDIFDFISAAMLTHLDNKKEKDISKKSNKVPKTLTKAVKKK